MKEPCTCCIFGHKKIIETEELNLKIYEIVEKMILDERVDTFLFGSKSRFNDLCLDIVTRLKEKYPHIKRIYVRAEYPNISEEYKRYLLHSYEDTYYPRNIVGAGRSIYIERNYEMINKSQFCIVYYDESNAPTNRKSGTKIALDYAIKKGKEVVNLPLLSKGLVIKNPNSEIQISRKGNPKGIGYLQKRRFWRDGVILHNGADYKE